MSTICRFVGWPRPSTARFMRQRRCWSVPKRHSAARTPEGRRRAVTDPFEVLRAPALPVDPDPAFATALRTRIERSLKLPRGVIVSDRSTLPEQSEEAAEPVPAAVPYLAVSGARDALHSYVDVLRD